jgi:hypothetical protein
MHNGNRCPIVRFVKTGLGKGRAGLASFFRQPLGGKGLHAVEELFVYDLAVGHFIEADFFHLEAS